MIVTVAVIVGMVVGVVVLVVQHIVGLAFVHCRPPSPVCGMGGMVMLRRRRAGLACPRDGPPGLIPATLEKSLVHGQDRAGTGESEMNSDAEEEYW
jgi:hypothetical protein